MPKACAIIVTILTEENLMQSPASTRILRVTPEDFAENVIPTICVSPKPSRKVSESTSKVGSCST